VHACVYRSEYSYMYEYLCLYHVSQKKIYMDMIYIISKLNTVEVIDSKKIKGFIGTLSKITCFWRLAGEFESSNLAG
jgi:hypothetical protein